MSPDFSWGGKRCSSVKSCSLVITMSAVSGAGEGGGAGGGVRPGVCTATGDTAGTRAGDTGALAVDMVAVDVLGDVDVVCVDVDVLGGVDVDVDVLGGVVEVVDVDVLGCVVRVVAAGEVTMTTVSGEVSTISATLVTDRLVLVLASGALLEVLEMVLEVVTVAANVVVSAFVSSVTVVTDGTSSDVVDTGVCGVVDAVVTLGESVRDCIHT